MESVSIRGGLTKDVTFPFFELFANGRKYKLFVISEESNRKSWKLVRVFPETLGKIISPSSLIEKVENLPKSFRNHLEK